MYNLTGRPGTPIDICSMSWKKPRFLRADISPGYKCTHVKSVYEVAGLRQNCNVTG